MIEYLVRMLVDEPDQIRVEERCSEGTTTYAVHVAPGDVGKIIGKEGRIANALRTIVKCVAMKHSLKVYLDIVPRQAAPADDDSDA